MKSTKFGILRDGEKCCDKMHIDFDAVYEKTNTSYKPIQINGKWYSDYKSASSVERVEAFIKLQRKDPVQYADEGGPVTWEQVVEHVKNVLSKHESA